MAQNAKSATEKAADNAKETTQHVAEQGKRVADEATEVTREAADRAEDAARRGLQLVERTAGAAGEVQRAVAQRSADGTAEIGRVLVDLTVAQTRHNLETLNALTSTVDWDQVSKAVDWDRVFKIQSDYLRTSIERAAQLTQRYLEVTQTVVNAAALTARREAKKAA